MRRLLPAVLLLWGCPDPQTGKIDPYLTAHAVISQAGMALPLAEGIFNQWLYQQKDEDKARKAQLTFAKIKTLVAHGLKLAHDGVDIAKQAKKDPDAGKLLARADTAWKDLYQFLGALLDKGDTPNPIEIGPGDEKGPPAVGPAAGVASKKAALVVRTSPITALPPTLLP